MKNIIQLTITHEDGMFVASSINAPIVTDGETFEVLQKNISEATSLYLEEMEGEYTKTPAVIGNFEFNLPTYA